MVTYRYELCKSEKSDATIRLHNVSFPIREMLEHIHVLLQSNGGKFDFFRGLGRFDRPLGPLLLRLSSVLHLKRELRSLMHLK